MYQDTKFLKIAPGKLQKCWAVNWRILITFPGPSLSQQIRLNVMWLMCWSIKWTIVYNISKHRSSTIDILVMTTTYCHSHQSKRYYLSPSLWFIFLCPVTLAPAGGMWRHRGRLSAVSANLQQFCRDIYTMATRRAVTGQTLSWHPDLI